MAHSDLINAFNDCVDRMQSGQSFEQCLRQYPQYANELRAMLEVGWAVRRADPGLPAVTRARMRNRVLAAAPYVTAQRDSSQFGMRPRFRSVTLMAAVLLLVLFAVALWLMMNRDDDDIRLNVETLTPHVTASATPVITATGLPAVTATGTAITTATPIVTPTATASATSTPTATPSTTAYSTATPTVVACVFEVTASSVNLRSGPGTGYGVIGYAYLGDRFAVLSAHASGTWVEIQAETDNAWISLTVGTLSGTCDGLPVSTQQYREASSSSSSSSGSGSGDDSDDSDDSSGPGSGSDDSDDDNSGHDDEPDEPDEPDDD